MPQQDLLDFDIVRYLEDRGIDYWTHGKNVARGWLGITCPFPHCSDSSNHCGVNLTTPIFNCWICHEKGSVVKLIKEIEQTTWAKAFSIAHQYSTGIITVDRDDVNLREKGNVWPAGCTSNFPKLHLQWLRRRGFDPKRTINKYNLRACHVLGKYKWRIIVPIIKDRRPLSFIAADVTGNSDIKYRTASIEESYAPPRDLLYNIDRVRNKKMAVVEGITDVWRVGNGAVATLGTEFTEAQIDTMIRKDLREVYICFDNDAIKQGESLAAQLSGILRHVEMIELEAGQDPDTMSQDDLDELRRLLR